MGDPTEVFGDNLFNLLPEVERDLDRDEGLLEKYFDAVEDELRTWETDTIDKIKASQDPDRATELDLRIMAWKQGFDLPTVKVERLRTFLAQSATFRANKGNFEVLASAIFVATGLGVTIEVPWQQAAYTVGVTPIGSVPIGVNFFAEPSNTYFVGGPIGGPLGSRAVNPTAPYEFRIKLLYNPGQKLLKVLSWVVDLFKRSIDIPIVVIPEVTQFWTIGQSKIGVDALVGPPCYVVGVTPIGGAKFCGPPPTPLRIILPDDTAIADE